MDRVYCNDSFQPPHQGWATVCSSEFLDGMRAPFSMIPQARKFCDCLRRACERDVWRWFPDCMIDMRGQGFDARFSCVKLFIRIPGFHVLSFTWLAA